MRLKTTALSSLVLLAACAAPSEPRDDEGRALIATFSRWWVKQAMNMTRSLPEEIYQSLTDRQKQMLGFCAIPPADEFTRINTKCGYEALLPSVADYYRTDQAAVTAHEGV